MGLIIVNWNRESVAWFDTPKGKAFSDKFWKEIVADVKKADPDLVITA